jgi:WD40 repeat protein
MGTDKEIPHGLTLRYTFRGHKEEINRITWSPDGRFLASSSFDTTVRVWDIQTGEMQRSLTGHTKAIYSVAWSPDGRLLASCSKDRYILIWDIQAEHYIYPYPGFHGNQVALRIWTATREGSTLRKNPSVRRSKRKPCNADRRDPTTASSCQA